MSQSSRVIAEVWSDYLCPFCYLDVPILDSVQAAWGERVILRWHSYELYPDSGPPMDPSSAEFREEWKGVASLAKMYGMVMKRPRISMRSRLALEAAEVAKHLGFFREMHHAIFQAAYERDRDIGSKDVLLRIADEVGLGGDRLDGALSDPQYASRVDQDLKLAQSLGMEGAPTLILRLPKEPLPDGRWISGTVSYAELDRAIEDLLREEAA